MGGPMSRAEATERSRISRSTAGIAVAELERLGLVTSGAARTSQRGRPSNVLAVAGRGARVLACELRPDGILLATQYLDLSIGDRRHIRMPLREMPGDVALREVSRHVRALLTESAVPCVGLGVAVPGMVDRRAGVATLVHPLGWRTVSVLEPLREEFPRLPVAVAQDALLAALAEFHFGAGTTAERMLLLISEAIGLGGAIVGSASAGRAADHALQAGHVIVDPRGPQCVCGARGCLELYADGRAFRAALGRNRAVTVDELPDTRQPGGWGEGPADLNQVVGPFATGLVSLVNVLGPDQVVLAGHLATLPEIAGAELRAALGESVVASAQDVRIHSARFDDGVMRGAALDAFDALLTDPTSIVDGALEGA